MTTTLFSNVRYFKDRLRERLKKLNQIIVSRSYVSRGYVFLIELDGKYYLLVNANDYHVALSHLPAASLDEVNLSSYIMGVPLVESENEALRVQTGVFQWACKL